MEKLFLVLLGSRNMHPGPPGDSKWPSDLQLIDQPTENPLFLTAFYLVFQ